MSLSIDISSCGQNSETRTVAPSGANLRLGRWPWTVRNMK